MPALVDPKMLVVIDIEQAIDAIPFIRMHNAFGSYTFPGNVLKLLDQAVCNDFRKAQAVSLKGPEHLRLERSESSLYRFRPSPDKDKTEEDCVNLDHTCKPGFFHGLVSVAQGPEDLEIVVDGLLVHSQQLGCFCRIDIDAKTRDIFFDPEGADFPVFQYSSRISEIFFCSRVFKKKNVLRI